MYTNEEKRYRTVMRIKQEREVDFMSFGKLYLINNAICAISFCGILATLCMNKLTPQVKKVIVIALAIVFVLFMILNVLI